MISLLLNINDHLIPRYFKLKIISLGLAFHSFTIGYFELPQLRIIFRFLQNFEIVRFNCISLHSPTLCNTNYITNHFSRLVIFCVTLVAPLRD